MEGHLSVVGWTSTPVFGEAKNLFKLLVVFLSWRRPYRRPPKGGGSGPVPIHGEVQETAVSCHGGSRILLVARREKVHSFSVDQSTGCDEPTRIKIKTEDMCIRVERRVQIEQSVKCCAIKLRFYKKNQLTGCLDLKRLPPHMSVFELSNNSFFGCPPSPAACLPVKRWAALNCHRI